MGASQVISADYVVNIRAQGEQFIKEIQNAKKELNNMGLDPNAFTSYNAKFNDMITKMRKELNLLGEKGFDNPKAFERMAEQFRLMAGEYEGIFKNLSGEKLTAPMTDGLKVAKQGLKDLEAELQNLQRNTPKAVQSIRGISKADSAQLAKAAAGGSAELEKEKNRQLGNVDPGGKNATRLATATQDLQTAQAEVKVKKEALGLTDKQYEKLQRVFEVQKAIQDLQNGATGKAKTNANAVISQNKDLIDQRTNNPTLKLGELKKVGINASDQASANTQIDEQRQKADELTQAIEKQAQAQQKVNTAQKAVDQDSQKSLAIKQQATNLSKTAAKIDSKNDSIKAQKVTIDEEEAAALQAGNTAKQEAINSGNAASQALNNQRDAALGAANAQQTLNDKFKGIKQLKSYIGYMFSATAIFMKIRQVVTEAINTFKELDKEFDAISIVTGKTMEELWASFSSLNSIAQKYGVTATNVVQVQKLFYQQGRTSVQVAKLTEETLTFAKITGLQFADATDKLTAALNAYNLEAGEANKITDAYAALASHAAASSEEIANAMSKVASIAALSGSTLNNTSAYLTKIIETTRESAETAGTALKTIIARFTEIDDLTESDQELLGDDYNFNNIEEALKQVGVASKNSAGEIRSFSDILGDLGPIWDQLNTNQQHYIATQAAGSRQQSRFIALMSDWQRTQELMSVADSSEGTGQTQLERSLESLETALNRLKSTWQEFYTKFLKSNTFKAITNSANGFLKVLTKMPPALSATTVILGFQLVKYLAKGVSNGTKTLTTALIKAFKTSGTAGIAASATKINTAIAESNMIATGSVNGMKFAYDSFAAAQLNASEAQKAGILLNQEEIAQLKLKEAAMYEETLAYAEQKGANLASMSVEQINALLQAEHIGLTKEEIKTLRQLKLQKDLNRISQELQNTAEEGGFFVKISCWLADELINSGLMKLIPTRWADATATAAQKIASAGWLAPLMAGVIAAGIATIAIVSHTKATKTNTASMESQTEAQNDYTQSLKEYKDVLKDLRRYEQLHAKALLTTEEEEELTELTNSLAETYPELVKYRDLDGNAVLKEADALESLLEQKEKEVELNAENLKQTKLMNAARGKYTEGTAGLRMETLQGYVGDYANAEKGTAAWSDIKRWASTGSASENATKNNIKKGLTRINEEGVFDRETLGKLVGKNIKTQQWNNFISDLKKNGTDDYQTYLQNDLDLSNNQIAILMDMNKTFGNGIEDLIKALPDAEDEILLQAEIANIEAKETKYGVNLSDSMKGFMAKSASDSEEKFNSEAGKYYRNDDWESFFNDFWGTKGALRGEKVSFSQMADPDKLLKDVLKSEGFEDFKKTDSGKLLTMSSLDETGLGDAGVFIAEKNFEYLKEIAEDTEKQQDSFFEELSKTSDFVQKRFTENFDVTKYSKETLIKTRDAPDTMWDLLGIDENSFSQETQQYLINLWQDSVVNVLETMDSQITELSRWGLTSAFLETFDSTQLKALHEQVATVYGELGAQGAIAFGQAWREAYNSLPADEREQFWGVDFTDSRQFSQYLGKFARGSSQYNALLNAYEKSGNSTKKANGDYESMKSYIKTDIEDFTKNIEALNSAAEGSLSWEDLTALIDRADKLGMSLSYENFSATAEGFKLAGTTAQQQTKALRNLEIQMGRAQLRVLADNLATEKATLDLYEQHTEQYRAEEIEAQKLNVESAESAYRAQQLYISWLHVAGETEDAKNAVEKIKEYISDIEKLDPFADINQKIENESNKLSRLEFRINFSTNKDTIAKAQKDYIATQQQIITDNIAKAKYGQAILDNMKKQIQGDNTLAKYLSFDDQGNILQNEKKLMDAYRAIENSSQSEDQKKYAKETLENVTAVYEKWQDVNNEINGGWSDAESAMSDLKEYYNELYENITTLEEKIYDTLEQSDQERLDQLEARYEKMKQLDEDYLDSVRDAIDKERSIRDQSKEYEDLEQQEKKLQLLKMSGGSATEIQALEKQIAEKRQDMADKEVDNLLDELEEENNARAEAMDEELEYEQEVYDAKVKYRVEYNQQIASLMQQSSTDILTWLKQNDSDYKAQTDAARKIWETEMEGTINKASASMKTLADQGVKAVKNELDNAQKSTKNANDMLTTYANNVSSKTKGMVDSISDVTREYTEQYNSINNLVDAYRDLAGAIGQYNSALGKKVTIDEKGNNTNQYPKATPTSYTVVAKGSDKNGQSITQLSNGKWYNSRSLSVGSNGYTTFMPGMTENNYLMNADIGRKVGKNGDRGWVGSQDLSTFDQFYTLTNGKYVGAELELDTETKKAMAKQMNIQGATVVNLGKSVATSAKDGKDKSTELFEVRWSDAWGIPQYIILNKTDLQDFGYKFANGGLVDYTGPAWVDGTPANPEAFLSAKDTKLIAGLTNVLGSIPINTAQPAASQNNGDTYYEIHINVDELGDGYSVDDLMDEMEDRILKASGRNQVIRV